MRILRIVSVTINDSTSIDVKFTEQLVSNLTTSNVTITSDTVNVPDSEVLSVKVLKDVLSITCQPLTPLATYIIEFKSTDLNPFISVHGEAKISEDGVSNRYLINGPLEAENPINNFFTSYYKDNIYKTDDDQSVISQYIKSLSINFAKALYDIRQIKNENYLSFSVIDEQKTRGTGPFDRLNEEGAYEIIRVGKGPTNTNANTTFSFDEFPSFPITLQRKTNIETLQVNSIDDNGIFNINTLTFNFSNKPITKVNSIIFTLLTANPVYTYNIEKFGYLIKDSRYDQDFGFTYLQLKDNQIKINEKILDDPNFSLDKIFKIDVEYETKDLGRVIDNNSVTVYTVETSIREVLPPIINVFNLQHAPIVDTNNNILNLDGVQFTDPNMPASGAKHPAFKNEIPFRLNGLPTMPGQYSIDYSTGTVYVFGADAKNDGTGAFPPLATYQYRFTYKSEQDYVFDADLIDLVALPKGNLVNSNGNINFNYEEVLILGTDYIAGMHQESLNERIGNNLAALNILKTVNSPITNVFRIINETSGEIYTVDRWSDNRVYFRFNNAPNVTQQVGERATFNTINNELLFVNTTINNAFSLQVFKIYLNNNNIISATEDSIASSINTSLVFSKSNIFNKEIWYNNQINEIQNINRLTIIGQYTVDYINGIIYCAVSNTQDFNIGTATYKNSVINLQNPHIISVDDIYYQISVLDPKNKHFDPISFADGIIIPNGVETSDELYLNGSLGAPYQIFNKNVGIFFQSSFISGVTNQIKFVRSLVEYDDLVNSTQPLNFSNFSTSNGFNVTVNSINNNFVDTVKFDGSNYYVNINENIQYLSPNITYTFTVTRASDSAPLWNNSGTIVTGDPVKLILPGINSPTVGDLVNIEYTFTINNLSRIVIDYNKGDYFIDYTYLADEILVSYEYGDNVLDFRKNKNLPSDTTYYVSYKAGALRDALIRNFGTLINVNGLTDPDLDFNRERYRDALTAALTSFIQGPTLNAIKNIGKNISHIEPEVIESVFQNWSLGSSLLNSEEITTSGEFQLLPAKFGNGVLVNNSEQSISFPLNSNLRLEEGTFETWIAPEWNGIDNDADLTFNILENGITIDPLRVFIGVSENHPTIVNGKFTINKNSNVNGKPNKNKDGVFIYYDKDNSGAFNRWYVEIIDGYVRPTSSNYKFTINSDGTFYDVKSIILPKPSNMTLFTGLNNVNFSIAGGSAIDEGLTFISDFNHYLLDFGQEKNKNRLSIFKDVSGYFNFRVYDKEKQIFSLSTDVSAWKKGDLHHIAASWKLNSLDNRDEMHLFIDGTEVPNIIKYGQKLKPYLHEKFRTINPEEIIGSTTRDIIGADDLHTVVGSSSVTSSINFSAYNIFIGDTIFIDEIGFSSVGYTIVFINGQTLGLNSPMPATLDNARFSVNRTQFTVSSEIDVAANIAVSTIHASVSGTDLLGISGTNTVSSASINFATAGVVPGFLIRIDDISLNTTYTVVQVNNNTLTLDDNLAVNVINESFRIYSHIENEIPGIRALHPSYSISKDINFNNILTISNNVIAGDLILIRTLGLNHKRIRREYYVWSDGYENILMTNMPSPISLDEAKITKVILPTTAIGSNNSTLILGVYQSQNFTTYQPSNSTNGRTISVTISGTNTDFSVPVQVTINGLSGVTLMSETISFTDYGTLDFANAYSYINFINVQAKPINANKSAVTVVVKEKYSITRSEFNEVIPIVKFSYRIGGGYYLQNDGINSVRDNTTLFSYADIGNYLVVYSPSTFAGYYKITGISSDRKSIYIDPGGTGVPLPVPSFSNGVYQVLNTTEFRSGLQNGFFTFEIKDLPGVPYYLRNGFYDLDYMTYARIHFDPLNLKVFVGSDFEKHHQINAIVDQVKIYSIMLTDTRIGESIPSSQKSITKDFNSLKELKSDSTTLMLLDFNSFPFTNLASVYIKPTEFKNTFQSALVVNDNFGNSTVITDKSILVPNEGILDTKKEGSIEFWMSPLFDTRNDPNTRYYFDAFGAVVEEAVSVDNVSVKISSPAKQILSVKLKVGDNHIDYFAGGKLEIDTQNAISEESLSLSNSSASTSKNILQVITVKIAGDLTGTDYFADGSVGTDKKTIYLGKTLPASSLPLIIVYQTTDSGNIKLNTQIIRLNKKLPYQKTKVIVNYIPKSLQGDRISIFKDNFGYINFAVTASGIEYLVRGPTSWSQGTWHRIKASYKINGGMGSDEIRLFLDGYQYTNVSASGGLFFGSDPISIGATVAGDGYQLYHNIKFKDSINDLFIGSQYDREFPAFTLIDNFRISNISRPIYAPFGEPLDVNYTSNLDMAFPVTEDLYTTYLLDFNTALELNEDFTTLKNRKTGIFDFGVNVFDSFDIVNMNIKSKEALETLIKVLKPANSRVFITYIK